MNVEIKENAIPNHAFTKNVATSSGFLMYSSCFRQHVGNSIFQREVKVENYPLIEFFFQIIFNQFVKSIYFPLLFSSK